MCLELTIASSASCKRLSEVYCVRSIQVFISEIYIDIFDIMNNRFTQDKLYSISGISTDKTSPVMTLHNL